MKGESEREEMTSTMLIDDRQRICECEGDCRDRSPKKKAAMETVRVDVVTQGESGETEVKGARGRCYDCTPLVREA